MNSDINTVQFERHEYFDEHGRALKDKFASIMSVAMCNDIYRYTRCFDALTNLDDNLINPSFDSHPHDLFTFSYNGKSFALTWEPACYTTDIGVI